MKKLSLYIGFACLGLLMGATSSLAQAVKSQAGTQTKTKAPVGNTEMKAQPAGVQRNTPAESQNKLNQGVENKQEQRSAQPTPASQTKTQIPAENKKTVQQSAGGKAK